MKLLLKKKNTVIFLISLWMVFAFSIYSVLWLFRFLEPWKNDLPVASTKESLKYLGRMIHLWPP